MPENQAEYENTVIKAATEASNKMYEVLRESGYESTHAGQVVPTKIYYDAMWEFIRIVGGYSHSPFLKLIDFSGVLHPDNQEDFNGQHIPKSVADIIIESARHIIDSSSKEEINLTPKIKAHLEDIINNGMPYGIIVTND